ncbi:uncharacterized protein LOC121824974 [Peromyscus maniculatus bairdii]|uniref:uncharacterized protein LOC121824974 n=1 Tax=Peromyscus maniculatus bairdii TaxID=230844 RepID=UPI003FD326B0
MLLHSPALQKLRPNLQHRRWDPRCAGDAGLPRSAPARRLPAVPQAPRGATSRGPAFLTERHRSPGYVVPPPAGSCWRLGTQAQPGFTAASCVASPSRNAGPAAPFLAGDPGRRGPRRKGPRGLGPRGHRIPRPAHLPTSAAAPDVPASPATRLRRLLRLPARAGHTRSPERPGRRRLPRDWRPE